MKDLFYCKIEFNNENYSVEYEDKDDAIDHAYSTYDIDQNVITYVVDDYDNIIWTSPNYDK